MLPSVFRRWTGCLWISTILQCVPRYRRKTLTGLFLIRRIWQKHRSDCRKHSVMTCCWWRMEPRHWHSPWDAVPFSTDGGLEEELDHLLEISTQAGILCCTAMIEAGAHCTSIGDSTAGPDVISPAMYGRYAMRYERELIRAVHKEGGAGSSAYLWKCHRDHRADGGD